MGKTKRATVEIKRREWAIALAYSTGMRLARAGVVSDSDVNRSRSDLLYRFTPAELGAFWEIMPGTFWTAFDGGARVVDVVQLPLGDDAA